MFGLERIYVSPWARLGLDVKILFDERPEGLIVTL